MRFLIDNALSPVLCAELASLRHDAIHVRDVALARAADHVIFDFALADLRCIISADTDFSLLLNRRKTDGPSVILFRGSTTREPSLQAKLLADNLPAILTALEDGAVVVFEAARVRVRHLPL